MTRMKSAIVKLPPFEIADEVSIPVYFVIFRCSFCLPVVEEKQNPRR